MDLNLNWSKYTTDQQWRDVSHRLLEKAQKQPGVMSAAVTSGLPLDPDGIPGRFPQRVQVEGHLTDKVVPVGAIRVATPDYFRTLGIPLIAGRGFAETDIETSLPVAVINRTLARHCWRDEDPVGECGWCS